VLFLIPLSREIVDISTTIPLPYFTWDFGSENNTDLLSGFTGNDVMILYLKAHACSPCNMSVLKRIIPTAAQNGNFVIFSHDSNRHFLSPLLEEVDHTKIEWFNESLYSGDNNQYDGELVITDNNGYIKGAIPVEYLKDELIFTMISPKLTDANISK
jgi:hypothetical protein